MSQLVRDLHTTLHELGVQLGHQLAANLLGEGTSVPFFLAETTAAAPSADVPRPLPSKPRILPGLSGRRRRPGEQPPRCGHPGCGRPSRTRGYCQTHYVRWLKAGADRNVG